MEILQKNLGQKGASASQSTNQLIFDKLKFPHKLETFSASRPNDFTIEVDDLSRPEPRTYKTWGSTALNCQDSSKYGFLNNTEELFENNARNGLKDIILSDFDEALGSNLLRDLQGEFVNALDGFSYNESNLARPNHLSTTFVFDPLSGEFVDSASHPIDYDNKTFSLESKHHEAGGKPTNINLTKTKLQKNLKALEGNKKLTSFNAIEEEKKRWSEVVLQTCEEEDFTVLDKKDLGDLIDSSLNILDVIDLTGLNTNDKEKSDEIQKVSLQYNNFWLSFAKHFDVEPEKVSQERTEEATAAVPEDEMDFEKEFDLNEIKQHVDLLQQSIEATEGANKSEKLENFEKGLTGAGIDGTKPVLPTKTIRAPVLGGYKWAVQDNTDLSNFYDLLPRNKFALEYSFELDDFQKRAVLHLENRESVFVAAHTSAGKTVVAEYAIALAKKHMTRAIYTSPIKALSNQKYRDFMNRFDSVGILTGDVTLKPEASCLIVTTEVLRSMLYKGSDIVKDIEWVIFDEVHYVNNDERGVVWEETIIMLPPHIGIIMLSATVPNAMEFANWVGMTKKRKIYVQTTYKRPTPLEHSLYYNGKFQIVKPKDGPFKAKEYEEFIRGLEKSSKDRDDFRDRRKVEIKEKFEEKGWKFKNDVKKEHFQRKQLGKALKNQGQVPTRQETFKEQKIREERTRYYQLIRHCEKEKLLPCVFFAFSKKKCMDLAFGLTGLDLCDSAEKRKITVFFNNAMKRLKPVDRDLPQLINLKDILLRGIAVHHGDLLPIAKEVVEILFADGLIKVLFATETFAMGVNMPAKSVVFCGLRKNDGKDFRYLKSSEYTQMSGRAGRRGLDDKGNVVLFIRDFQEFPQVKDLKDIIDHKGEQLQSKFRLTYGIIFNLLLSKEINVLDVMRRSFVEHGKVTSLPEQIKKLKSKKEELTATKKEYKCKVMPFAEVMPIEDYVSLIEGLKTLTKDLWTHPTIVTKMVLPKFARVIRENGEIDVGILLTTEKTHNGWVYKTLFGDVLPKEANDGKLKIGYEEEHKLEKELTFDTFKVCDVRASEIIDVFNEKLSDFGRIELELRGKQKADVQQALLDNKARLVNSKNDKDSFAFTVGSYEKRDQSISQLYTQIKKARNNLEQHICHKCDMKEIHLEMFDKINGLNHDIKALSKDVSDDNVAYLDQFEARIKVLQELSYLDPQQNPLIKARIARELGNADIFLCEVIMENVLLDLKPEEIAALLSGFVCQVKRVEISYNDLLPDELLDAREQVYDIAQRIMEIEKKHNVIFEDEETYIDQTINFSLMKVVYEWANQKDFAEICQLTDAQEGSIVRTILRLDILLRDFKSACKIMGNMKLHKLIDDASHLIRRDIVFAGSLYLE